MTGDANMSKADKIMEACEIDEGESPWMPWYEAIAASAKGSSVIRDQKHRVGTARIFRDLRKLIEAELDGRGHTFANKDVSPEVSWENAIWQTFGGLKDMSLRMQAAQSAIMQDDTINPNSVDAFDDSDAVGITPKESEMIAERIAFVLDATARSGGSYSVREVTQGLQSAAHRNREVWSQPNFLAALYRRFGNVREELDIAQQELRRVYENEMDLFSPKAPWVGEGTS